MTEQDAVIEVDAIIQLTKQGMQEALRKDIAALILTTSNIYTRKGILRKTIVVDGNTESELAMQAVERTLQIYEKAIDDVLKLNDRSNCNILQISFMGGLIVGIVLYKLLECAL